jgi:FlaA1/EpsC-like NDP-sugar epimerase
MIAMSQIRLISQDEMKQYDIQQEYNQPSMRYFIGDVEMVNG